MVDVAELLKPSKSKVLALIALILLAFLSLSLINILDAGCTSNVPLASALLFPFMLTAFLKPFGIALLVELIYLYMLSIMVSKLYEKSGNNKLFIIGSVIFYLLLLILLFIPMGCESPPAGSFKTLTIYSIRDLNSRGYGVVEPKKVALFEGDTIFIKEITQNLPISATNVSFYCSASEICNAPNAPIDLQKTRISANRKIDVWLVSCANERNNKQITYCIVIGNDPSTTTSTCEQECDVT